MDLVEIDVVRLEAPQAHFDGVHDVSTRRAHVIAARADTRVNLGRKHDVLTGDVQILERLTKCLLALPFGVDVSCVEEVDASVEASPDQFVGSRLADRTDRPVDSLATPKVIVPRQRRETRSPVLPRFCIAYFSFLTNGFTA